MKIELVFKKNLYYSELNKKVLFTFSSLIRVALLCNKFNGDYLKA